MMKFVFVTQKYSIHLLSHKNTVKPVTFASIFFSFLMFWKIIAKSEGLQNKILVI